MIEELNLPYLLLAFGGGVVLGFFYFGALWVTVQYLPRIRRPGLFFLGSFWVRLLLTLTGFYLIMADHWERLAACFLGFLLIRRFLLRRYGPTGINVEPRWRTHRWIR